MYRVMNRIVNNEHNDATEWEDPQQQEPFEIMEWEDILDDHGEPEPVAPGVWVVKAGLDMPLYNIKSGEITALIIRIPR